MAVRILTGDCRGVLATLPDESVHCVVTSPPYFGLRDYGVAGQIGLEDTPAAFVAEMVAVFRDVRRVLRKDGTLWLNLGDSYASVGGGYSSEGSRGKASVISPKTQRAVLKGRNRNGIDGLKPKDLIGIPWRVAFALQTDGWWLRQDIIWHKPNPMPESITDRCTKAHEYLFLLTKSERYAYDAAAVAEPVVFGDGTGTGPQYAPPGGGPAHRGLKRSQKLAARTVERSGVISGGTAASTLGYTVRETRNKRSVWSVPTTPFADAHFATFPPDLIEPCIKAGCPAGGTVLDPFGGAGTTGLVADRLGRDAILIELNPAYATMARDRLARDGGMFANLAAE